MNNPLQFTLKAGDEYIPLMKLLKYMQLVQSGGEARILIDAGEIHLYGQTEFRKRAKIRSGDVVTWKDIQIHIDSESA